jgi:flavodoxin
MPKSNKTAIICYSKTGHSRAIAARLARALDADVLALQTQGYRMPFFGYLRAGV